MPRLTDTSPEAERAVADAHRRMAPERKWRLIGGLIGQGRNLHAAGVRLRRPGATPAEIRDDWIAIHYGAVPEIVGEVDRTVIPPDESMRVVRDVIDALESIGAAYALGGSMASSAHGVARFTADADLTVEPFPGREEEFAGRFGPDYFVSVDAIRGAFRHRVSFNVVNTMIGFKVDVFVKKDRPFDDALMARRTRVAALGDDGPPIALVSAEDVMLLKLEWYRLGGESSDRQWSDVLGVLRVQGDRLEDAYLDRWAGELGVADLLGRARAEAAP